MLVDSRGFTILAVFLFGYLALTVAGPVIIARQPDLLRREEPPVFRQNITGEPFLGMDIPKDLVAFGLPKTFVVHADCLTCTLVPDPKVAESFASEGVINVVVAADKTSYQWFVEHFPKAIVHFGTQDLAKALRASFGPRIYRFDQTGRLSYFQALPTVEISREISRARNY